MERIIFHIDVNNAFLSWTAIDLLRKGYKTDIRNIVAVIGGDESRRSGIVVAKSTPAKKLGIVTAETLYSARKKAPNVQVFPPDYHFYLEMSNKLFNLLKNYSPDIEVASVDECYLDYGKVKKLYGDEVEFAYKLKDQIYNELGFTVNIGIANNKLCAKMASDFQKPNKVHTLYSYQVKEKMWPLPVGELFGIGKMSVPKLNQIGINTIGDLANYDSNKLYKYFKNQAIWMINSANGIDNSPVVHWDVDPKGISHETTLRYDLSDKKELEKILLALCENVSIKLRKQKKYTNVVAVIIKDQEFKKRTHQKKLVNATNITEEIYNEILNVFHEMWDNEPVRLIGVRLDNLSDNANHQVSLFDNLETREKNNELDKVIDNLKDKYGNKIIKKASLNENKIERHY